MKVSTGARRGQAASIARRRAVRLSLNRTAPCSAETSEVAAARHVTRTTQPPRARGRRASWLARNAARRARRGEPSAELARHHADSHEDVTPQEIIPGESPPWALAVRGSDACERTIRRLERMRPRAKEYAKD